MVLVRQPGVKSFSFPSGTRRFLSPGHIRFVSACLIWTPKTEQFTHVRSQIPVALLSATNSSRLFQVEVPLIWARITVSHPQSQSCPLRFEHTCLVFIISDVLLNNLSPRLHRPPHPGGNRHQTASTTRWPTHSPRLRKIIALLYLLPLLKAVSLLNAVCQTKVSGGLD